MHATSTAFTERTVVMGRSIKIRFQRTSHHLPWRCWLSQLWSWCCSFDTGQCNDKLVRGYYIRGRALGYDGLVGGDDLESNGRHVGHNEVVALPLRICFWLLQ